MCFFLYCPLIPPLLILFLVGPLPFTVNHLLTHSFTHSLAHSLTPLLIHPLTHPIAHSLTLSLLYSVWRYRGGRDGHETLQQFMNFLNPKSHDQTSHAYPGVAVFFLPSDPGQEVDITRDFRVSIILLQYFW